jgi:hypothetical protein
MNSARSRTDTFDEVGYGKPPRHTQFQSGRSGNPKGRPKGSKNSTTLIKKELLDVANENGRQRKITKVEAIIKQLVNKAALGDHRSIALLLDKIPDLRIEPENGRGGITPETKQAMYEIMIGDILKQPVRDELPSRSGDD